LTDQALLVDIAKDPYYRGVRGVAVERLTDQALLADIAKNDSDLDVRRRAVERLTDQALLADIAKDTYYRGVREVAAGRLTDQALLADLAKNDSDLDVRMAALERVEDQELRRRLQPSFFECEVPTRKWGRCSANQCPCLEAIIRRGDGYLWISEEVVDFRSDARSLSALKLKLVIMQASAAARDTNLLIDPAVYNAVLVCEQGAKRRGMDLNVSGAEARHWWRTGQVPLRPTPVKK